MSPLALQKVKDIRIWVTDSVVCEGELHTVHWSPVAGGRLILDNHSMKTEEDQMVIKAMCSLDKESMPYCVHLYNEYQNNNLYYDPGRGFFTFGWVGDTASLKDPGKQITCGLHAHYKTDEGKFKYE